MRIAIAADALVAAGAAMMRAARFAGF